MKVAINTNWKLIKCTMPNSLLCLLHIFLDDFKMAFEAVNSVKHNGIFIVFVIYKSICTYPCPIFSIFVYFLFGSPSDTMVLNFSIISSSVIFFFFGLSFLLACVPFGFSSSTGLVYWIIVNWLLLNLIRKGTLAQEQNDIVRFKTQSGSKWQV